MSEVESLVNLTIVPWGNAQAKGAVRLSTRRAQPCLLWEHGALLLVLSYIRSEAEAMHATNGSDITVPPACAQVWQCQHGPGECMGNTIESCVFHLYPVQSRPNPKSTSPAWVFCMLV